MAQNRRKQTAQKAAEEAQTGGYVKLPRVIYDAIINEVLGQMQYNQAKPVIDRIQSEVEFLDE